MRMINYFWGLVVFVALTYVACDDPQAPAIGYAIAFGAIAAFVGAAIVMIQQWRSAQPKLFNSMPSLGFKTIGVRFHKSAVLPWAGMYQALDAASEVLANEYGVGVATKMMDFWVDVYGKSEPISTAQIPGGVLVDPKTGEKSSVAGTIDRETFFMGLRGAWVVKIMQCYSKQEKQSDGTTAQSGDLLDVGASALFHEIAQHMVPYVLDNDWNVNHTMTWTQALEARMSASYARKRQLSN